MQLQQTFKDVSKIFSKENLLNLNKPKDGFEKAMDMKSYNKPLFDLKDLQSPKSSPPLKSPIVAQQSRKVKPAGVVTMADMALPATTLVHGVRLPSRRLGKARQ